MSCPSLQARSQGCVLAGRKNAFVGFRSLHRIGSKECALLSPIERRHVLQRQQRLLATQVFPFDQAWAPDVDAASVAPQLFAMSLFPYLCFLFYLTKSGKTPKLTLAGFYFLLVFVGATIPAGIYAKSHYGTSLANVDWLHGAAESLLTITNLLIVLGLRQGIREAEAAKTATADLENLDGKSAALRPITTSEAEPARK